MKNLLLFVVILFLSSCADENLDNSIDFEKTVNFSNPFESKIGILKSGEFINISKAEINSILRANSEITSDRTFSDFKIVNAKVEEGEDDYLIFQSTSDDKTVSIGMRIEIDKENQWLLLNETETCTCTSTCDSGCEVWTMCKCTSCFPSGECTREHKLTKSPD